MHKTSQTPNATLYEWTDPGPASIEMLGYLLEQYRSLHKKIVTTNGCFDLLHVGHVRFLSQVRTLGDVLIVGINSDRAVRYLKGSGRPILSETDRAIMLSGLKFVNHVIVFDDTLPNEFLNFVKPDVHCKGGDYAANSLPESATVNKYGGRVCILPIISGYSTSQMVQKVISSFDDYKDNHVEPFVAEEMGNYLLQSGNLLRQLAYEAQKSIITIAGLMVSTLRSGNKIMFCGNGGSAADAGHFASELVGRFGLRHIPLSAVSLSSDISVITGIANDYSFNEIFSRQVIAIGNRGDLLFAISTSGESKNVIKAVEVAHELGILVVGLTGNKESSLKKLTDYQICIPSQNTALIQQGYLAVFHAICYLIEHEYSARPSSLETKP